MPVPLEVNKVYEVDVQGFGFNDSNTIANVFHMVCANLIVGAPTLEQLLTYFRDTFWRPLAVTLLNKEYRVATYRVRRIFGVVPLVPTPLHPHPFKTVYDQQYVLPGTALDVGGVDDTALPAYAAVSVRKVCLSPSRYFRGGTRYAIINEGDTNLEGNELTVLRYPAWAVTAPLLNGPFATLVPPDLDSAGMIPCVFSGTAMAWNPFGPDPVNNSSPIITTVVHRYLGSQVSRKIPVTGT